MSFEVTQRAALESQKLNKAINIVLEIDGVNEVFTTLPIKEVLNSTNH